MAASPLPRLRRLALSLPQAFEKISHGEPTFWVHKRMFAMFGNANTHHGSGRHAVWVKSTHVTQDLLVSRSPKQYFVPPYVGVSGWVGMYLDGRTDWAAVAERLRDGYRLAAPKRLLAALDGAADQR